MPSLAFELLDRHVVEGRGDDIAFSEETDAVTFAEMVERSAALAGGLRALGVRPGDEVLVSMGASALRVVVVCACIRLGAVPGDAGGVRIVESAESVIVHADGDEHDLDLVIRAGKTDPAPSLSSDPPGYAATVLEKWPMLDAFAP